MYIKVGLSLDRKRKVVVVGDSGENERKSEREKHAYRLLAADYYLGISYAGTVSITRNIRRKEYEPGVICLSRSLVAPPLSPRLSLPRGPTVSPACLSSSLFLFALSYSEQRVSVCEVCQGPPHSAIPFSKLKVKSNSLCCYTQGGPLP